MRDVARGGTPRGDAAALPEGMAALDRWSYRGVDCAVGSVGQVLYGLARVGGLGRGWSSLVPSPALSTEERRTFAPENLGEWVVIPTESPSRYWSSASLSRFVTSASPDLVAWDMSGHTWAIQHVQCDVNAYVDRLLGPVPVQRAEIP